MIVHRAVRPPGMIRWVRAAIKLILRRVDVRWILAFAADVAALVLNWSVVSDLPTFTLFTGPTLTALVILGAIHGWRWCGWFFIVFDGLGGVFFLASLGLSEFVVGVLYLAAALLAWSAMRAQQAESDAVGIVTTRRRRGHLPGDGRHR